MLSNYIKIAWKVLLRHPFYTFITLFGITFTLTILLLVISMLDHVFGVHYPEVNRDRSLYVQRIEMYDSTKSFSMYTTPSYAFIKKYVTSLKIPQKVAAICMSGGNTYLRNKRIKLQVIYANADYWDVFQFDFLDGKPFRQNNIDQHDQVAVISEKLGLEYFGSGVEAVGKSIQIENDWFRVIGVAKAVPYTRPFSSADVYLPYNITKSHYQDVGIPGSFVAVLMAPDKTQVKAMQAEYSRMVRQMPLPIEAFGSKYFYFDSHADGYMESFLRSSPMRSVSESGKLYAIGVLLMLLFMSLPALNLVNISISRMMERSSEISIRKAFGAPNKTLMGQFIIENLFLTAIGGGLALICTLLLLQVINNSGWIPFADLTINFRVFAWSLFACLLFGLLSGVYPAYRMSKMNIVSALKA
jgi:putative ABC transport system permease protein